MTGLLSKASRQAGKFAGAPVGNAIATKLPAPKAKTATTPKGGSFCGTMTAYRYPQFVRTLSDAEIAALTGGHAGTLADLDEHGARYCPDWKAASGLPVERQKKVTP